MDIYYINGRNQKIDFTERPYKMLAATTLFDYLWTYSTKTYNNASINRFAKEMVEKGFDINIRGTTRAEFKEAVATILKVFDYDVRNKAPGKLYVGTSYLRCYIIGASRSQRYVNTTHCTVTFTVVADKDTWIEETTNRYISRTNSPDSDSLNYPYGYPYNYMSNIMSDVINNTGYSPTGFELKIYGAVSNPSVYIADHEYNVGADIETGEYLVINSMSREIYKVATDGTKVNAFSERNRESYIFEAIPEGLNSVAWNGLFCFDITLLIERSEPVWT